MDLPITLQRMNKTKDPPTGEVMSTYVNYNPLEARTTCPGWLPVHLTTLGVH